MAVEIKKKKGESVGSFIFRFNKRVRQSGLMKEVKKRKFTRRAINKRKRKSAALYRLKKQEELTRLKKYGFEGKNK